MIIRPTSLRGGVGPRRPRHCGFSGPDGGGEVTMEVGVVAHEKKRLGGNVDPLAVALRVP